MTLHSPADQSPDLKDASFEQLFSTDVLSYQWPDSEELNASLCAFAEGEMSKSKGISTTTTNVGGWHSPKSLDTSDNPAVQSILSRFELLVRELARRKAKKAAETPFKMHIGMWCNVNGAHHYNEPHIHRNCTWAGVYYAEVPELDAANQRAGALEMFDPRPAALLVPIPGHEYDITRLFRPQNGLMVIFPSWLVHMVHPYEAGNRRISFASNIQVSAA